MLCNSLNDISVIGRVIGTASVNNHPAYVIGYSFVCRDTYKNRNMVEYVGWMNNLDSNKNECVIHGENKDQLINTLDICSGGFRATGGS